MSETLVITETWPATIPLPFVDYSGLPRNATLVSSTESANILRRSRFQKSYTSCAVKWVLDEDEFAAFKTFFESDLDLGAAQFKLELRYPQNSILTEWAVKFVGGYDATYQEGRWEVTAQLDLISVTVLPDGAAAVGWGQFFVEYGEETTADDSPFYTSEGYIFYVKDP